MVLSLQILLFTILSCWSLNSHANPKCLKAALQRLKESHPAPSSFNDREKLSVKLTKEMKPLLQTIDRANKTGREIRKVQGLITRLRNAKPKTQEITNQLHDLELGFGALNRELIDLNNDFTTKMQALFKEDGIPSVIVSTKDESFAWRFFNGKNPAEGKEVLTLKLDMSAKATTHEGYNYYKEIWKKFGISEVTLSLKETAEDGFRGAFYGHIGRLEIGPEGARGLIQDYINSTGKHESRHAMFFQKRNLGDDSIFHTQFMASDDGVLLNKLEYYDDYMSAEELYTFSTDLQNFAQVLTKEAALKLKDKIPVLNQALEKAENLIIVASTVDEVTATMIKNLNGILAKPHQPPSVNFQTAPDGSFTLNFEDELGRSTTTAFVSEAEKKLLLQYEAANVAQGQAGDAYVKQELKKRGIDSDAFGKRIQSNSLTSEDSRHLNEITGNFFASAEGKILQEAIGISLRPVVIAAKVRMEKLGKLARIQKVEAKKLVTMLKQSLKPSHLDAILEQMFHIAKNVKEDYKGFALKPKPKVEAPKK